MSLKDFDGLCPVAGSWSVEDIGVESLKLSL